MMFDQQRERINVHIISFFVSLDFDRLQSTGSPSPLLIAPPDKLWPGLASRNTLHGLMSYITSQVSGPSQGVTLHSSFHLSQQYVRMALTHIQRGFLYIAVNSCGTKLAVMSALALARILLVNGAPLLSNREF